MRTVPSAASTRASLPSTVSRAISLEVAAVVDQLVQDRLILPIDGRLVGLAVQNASTAMPGSRDFPGGQLRIPEIQHA
ncbi:hypothetical protein [Streptomyces fumanus]|uniref:Uncharacterized protein n=1 Tax=Streptomyces fumanus TaxID=67302 RepID=A0A919E9V4_9ACTN|nr:hypothetical protein [Streptomyces fumanus]GHF28110.1 hypothetical protein GCM10018772_62240 [Streptomyces fumanus]